LKEFPVARRGWAGHNERSSEWAEERRGRAMLSTRVLTGLWGLALVNAVLLFIQVSTNLALRLI
jgi:hypothetical protein